MRLSLKDTQSMSLSINRATGFDAFLFQASISDINIQLLTQNFVQMVTNDILSNEYCFSDALLHASTYISDEQSKLNEFVQQNQQPARAPESD